MFILIVKCGPVKQFRFRAGTSAAEGSDNLTGEKNSAENRFPCVSNFAGQRMIRRKDAQQFGDVVFWFGAHNVVHGGNTSGNEISEERRKPE